MRNEMVDFPKFGHIYATITQGRIKGEGSKGGLLTPLQKMYMDVNWTVYVITQ